MSGLFDKFHGLKIYEKDNLVRDFKLCMDKNGTIGVYDFVSEKFFKLDGVENYKIKEETETKCNCWCCVAEKLFNAKQVDVMKIGKVYLHQMYREFFMEFNTLEEVEQFRQYANENIPYWNYDPVNTYNLNDYEQIIVCKHYGWIRDCEN